MKTNTAFIGSGNMASAIVDGLLARDPSARERIACFSAADGTAGVLAKRTGIRAATDLPGLLTPADFVVLAFKPQHLASADSRLAALTSGKLVLSILAGKPLSALQKVFPNARNIVRAMPNTPAAIGAGITAFCSLHPLAPADRAVVEELLGAMGKFLELAEEQMNAVTALSGSGPAFLFEFVAALRDGGIAAKLPPDIAARLAVETVLGSARLLAERGVDPEVLRNQVTSPNGTTLAGLQTMEAGDFRGLMRKTILAAQARSVELSRDA